MYGGAMTDWVARAREELPVIFENAKEDELTSYVIFWNNRRRQIEYQSVDEFEQQVNIFAEHDVYVEGSVFKNGPGQMFVEYFLFTEQNDEATPHHLALALTSTVIKRTLLYAKCFPHEHLTTEEMSVFSAKVQEQESQRQQEQEELNEELKDVDVVFILP